MKYNKITDKWKKVCYCGHLQEEHYNERNMPCKVGKCPCIRFIQKKWIHIHNKKLAQDYTLKGFDLGTDNKRAGLNRLRGTIAQSKLCIHDKKGTTKNCATAVAYNLNVSPNGNRQTSLLHP